jgi:hypothetical protein
VRNYPVLGGAPMLGHHVIGIACIMTSLFNHKAHSYALAGLVTEITTPSINLLFWWAAGAGGRGRLPGA